MKWRFREDEGWKDLFDEATIMEGVQVCSAVVQPLRPDEGSDLSASERSQLNGLLNVYSDRFQVNEEPTPYAEHCIELTDTTPIAEIGKTARPVTNSRPKQNPLTLRKPISVCVTPK